MSISSSGPVVSATDHPVLARIARVLNLISRISLYVAGIGLVAMTLIVFWQIFVRFVLGWSNSWTEVTAILVMSWFIFLGAAAGVRENSHLGFDVLLYVLPNGSKKVLRTISDVVVLAFAIGMIIYGWSLVQLQWRERLPSLGISGAFRYLPLFAGGILIALFSIERIVLRLAGVDVDPEIGLSPEEVDTPPPSGGA
jgi:TRAP-type C4-dicarboxylate transport system permease small subunit